MNCVPPLNKGFFRNCRKDIGVSDILDKVKKSLISLYGMNPLVESNDNLENILVKVHSDLLSLGTRASGREGREEMFRNLVSLLTRRVANTTNELDPAENSNIRKILSFYLGKRSFAPKDICLVTFNYDLHIERNLAEMDALKMFNSYKGSIFNFPYLYNLGENIAVTNPTYKKQRKKPILTFSKATVPRKNMIALLKLHGSLNWYSVHTSSKPSYNALIKSKKHIRVTTRIKVNPYMFFGVQRRLRTHPVVVPPIIGKATIFPQHIKKVWAAARERLNTATEVVIFGYSFPSGDYESINMLENTIGQNEHCHHVQIINPNPSVIPRMGFIPQNKPIMLFPDVDSFLASHN